MFTHLYQAQPESLSRISRHFDAVFQPLSDFCFGWEHVSRGSDSKSCVELVPETALILVQSSDWDQFRATQAIVGLFLEEA